MQKLLCGHVLDLLLLNIKVHLICCTRRRSNQGYPRNTKLHSVNVYKLYLETLWCNDNSLVWEKHVIKDRLNIIYQKTGSSKQQIGRCINCKDLFSVVHNFITLKSSALLRPSFHRTTFFHCSPSSINLMFSSIPSAGVFNNETAAQFTQEIVHVIFFSTTLNIHE